MNKRRSWFSLAKHWSAVSLSSVVCGSWGFIIGYVSGFFLTFGTLYPKSVNDRFWLLCSATVTGLGFAVFPFATLHRHVPSTRARRAAGAGALVITLLSIGIFGSALLAAIFYSDEGSDTNFPPLNGPLLLVITLIGVGTSTRILFSPAAIDRPPL